MPITFDLVAYRFTNIDPDDVRGPITLRFPALTPGIGSADNGVWVGLKAITFGSVPVTFELQGAAEIYDPNLGGSLTSLTGSMSGAAMRFEYDSEFDRWLYYADTGLAPQMAILAGPPANISPGASYTAIQNWQTAFDSQMFSQNVASDAATGIITTPRNGIYDLTCQLVFQQGNSNKELAIILEVRSSVKGDIVISSLQVSDDKTDYRTLGLPAATFSLSKGETMQLGLSRVNQSLGTCNFISATFRLVYLQSSQVETLYVPGAL